MNVLLAFDKALWTCFDVITQQARFTSHTHLDRFMLFIVEEYYSILRDTRNMDA